MLTPSGIFRQILYTWIPVYLVLMIHGSTLTTISEFLMIFVIAPLAIGVALAGFNIKFGTRERETLEWFEQVGIPATRFAVFVIVLYILIPVSLAFFCMLYAQNSQEYQGAIAGLASSLGGITIKEILNAVMGFYSAKANTTSSGVGVLLTAIAIYCLPSTA